MVVLTSLVECLGINCEKILLEIGGVLFDFSGGAGVVLSGLQLSWQEETGSLRYRLETSVYSKAKFPVECLLECLSGTIFSMPM